MALPLMPVLSNAGNAVGQPSASILEKEEYSASRVSLPQANPETYHAPKPGGRRPLDINLYANKKTMAQGMMDLALLTANSHQLSTVVNKNVWDGYSITSATLIVLSIVLQLAIGVALIFVGKFNIRDASHARRVDRLNNWIVLAVFFITIINVFVSSFATDMHVRNDAILAEKIKKEL